MNVDVDKITSDIDSNDGKRIFPMMDLSTISVHDRFLESSILDGTSIDIEFAVFIWSECECTIADDTIDDEIIMLMRDSMKLWSSFFFEDLSYSTLDIGGRR
jgi:hypothetical protein